MPGHGVWFVLPSIDLFVVLIVSVIPPFFLKVAALLRFSSCCSGFFFGGLAPSWSALCWLGEATRACGCRRPSPLALLREDAQVGSEAERVESPPRRLGVVAGIFFVNPLRRDFLAWIVVEAAHVGAQRDT